MRQLIDIITDASQDSVGNARDLDVARKLLTDMSPMARYKLWDKVAGIRKAAGDPLVRGDEKYRAMVEYVAANLAEFAPKPEPVDTRDLEDGGIHRLY